MPTTDAPPEGLPAITYATWHPDRPGRRDGQVAVYHDHAGTHVKITIGGVVRCYERIDDEAGAES